jgi:hypothetical protein
MPGRPPQIVAFGGGGFFLERYSVGHCVAKFLAKHFDGDLAAGL